ncbi:hypothetical protein ACSOCI_12330 (plasmid) [Levilactobacillus brevis]|uniref:hypothetical protein n=1 Tax=Levilactobacillus brevis TaxID=1580 RepID=UPI003F60966A
MSKEESETCAARFFKNDYHDRGMLKWQGFFLSDHTSAIKKEAAQDIPVLRPEMNQSEIGRILNDSWESCTKVSIQLNQVNGNAFPVEINGYVKGYQEDKICISVKGNMRLISIESVKNVIKF